MQQITSKHVHSRSALTAVLLALSLGITGCSHFSVRPAKQYVFVTAKQTFLRDRVAAVSNRTGTVSNGEKLLVLDHARRFVKVQTPSGEVGWIEERMTAGQDLANRFEALGKQDAVLPVVAHATTSDEVYLHVAPGRQTDRFYLLPENDALSLLERASVPKPPLPGAAPVAKPARAVDAAAVAAPDMEDWWLVRDGKGQTGWIYGRMIDISTPDTLLRYTAGQRIVGAYVLAHIDDPESGAQKNGVPETSIPEYVTVLSPYKAGLPYDFNQVRVFIWNPKKHRYETGFSERNIAGYLPVKIGEQADIYAKAPMNAEKLPSFTYRVLPADQPLPEPDPATGLVKPARTVDKNYLLEGNICRRLIAPGVTAPEEAHPDPKTGKKEREGRRRRRR